MQWETTQTVKGKVIVKNTNVFGRRSTSKYGFIDNQLLTGISRVALIDLLVSKYDLDKAKATSIIKGHIHNVVDKRKEAQLIDTNGLLQFVPKEVPNEWSFSWCTKITA